MVDNHSTDASCEMLQTRFSDVQQIANTTNAGFAKANNQAVACAKGKYILIPNPDTVVSEDTFIKLLNFAMCIFYQKHFRLNAVYDFVMSFGIKLWYWIKYFQIKNRRIKLSDPDNILFVGIKNDTYHSIQKNYQTKNLYLYDIGEKKGTLKSDRL